MSITEAINTLIVRNQSLVNKSGVSDYTKMTDEVINAILQYIHNTTAEINTLKSYNNTANILLQMYGIEECTEIDSDFLERFLKYDIISMGLPVDNIDDIQRLYDFYKTRLEFEFSQYLFVKDMFSVLKEKLQSSYPDYCDYVEKQYTDHQVKELIKKKLLFQYE